MLFTRASSSLFWDGRDRLLKPLLFNVLLFTLSAGWWSGCSALLSSWGVPLGSLQYKLKCGNLQWWSLNVIDVYGTLEIDLPLQYNFLYCRTFSFRGFPWTVVGRLLVGRLVVVIWGVDIFVFVANELPTRIHCPRTLLTAFRWTDARRFHRLASF